MDQQEATEFISDRLSQGFSVEAVAEMLCARTGWPRRQVELFVRTIDGENDKPVPESENPEIEEVEASEAGPPASDVAGHPHAAAPVMVEPRSRQKRVDEAEQRKRVAEFVVREMGWHADQDEIIRAVCEQTSWPWQEARHFVHRVEIEQRREIVSRQSPLLILIGTGIVLGGIGLAAAMAYLTLNGEYISLAGVTTPYAENAAFFIVGLGMFLGGIAGIWRAMSLIRE